MRHERLQLELLDPSYNTGRVVQGIHEQNGTLIEWRHFRQRTLHRALADL